MAITFVGANTGVTGNNASLVPTIHASAVALDTILLLASIRNTAATIGTPAGYAVLVSSGNVVLFYKTHSGTESSPTVTFAGGAAGDDTLAQIAVFRGLKVNSRGTASITNGSAQDIALPTPVTPTRAKCLMLTVGWKQDDWTSVAALAGQTEIGETFSTVGNDAAMVWDYSIQTTAAASPTGPFTVTGGAAAVSKSFVIALDQLATISTGQVDTYPPRVNVTVTNMVIGDSVELYRIVGGFRTALRGANDLSVSDTSFIRLDAEMPFGVPVSYLAIVAGVEYTSSPTTFVLPNNRVVLSDALSGLAAEVIILAWDEKQYSKQASTFKVGARNVVVSGPLGMFESTIELVTETMSSRDNLWVLLENTTEGIVQIRQDGNYPGVDSYIAVLTAAERRWSQDGSDPRRITSVQVAEVDKWAETLEAHGFTLQDIADAYTGQTLQDLSDDYATLLLLAQGEFGV